MNKHTSLLQAISSAIKNNRHWEMEIFYLNNDLRMLYSVKGLDSANTNDEIISVITNWEAGSMDEGRTYLVSSNTMNTLILKQQDFELANLEKLAFNNSITVDQVVFMNYKLQHLLVIYENGKMRFNPKIIRSLNGRNYRFQIEGYKSYLKTVQY